MRGAEGVVDVDVGQRGQAGGELGVVLRLPRLVADVLEQQHVARTRARRARSSTSSPDHRRRQLHRRAEQLGEPLGDRPQRQLRLAVLRPAEVRDEHQRGPALAQLLDRRQRGADPGVVGDRAVRPAGR